MHLKGWLWNIGDILYGFQQIHLKALSWIILRMCMNVWSTMWRRICWFTMIRTGIRCSKMPMKKEKPGCGRLSGWNRESSGISIRGGVEARFECTASCSEDWVIPRNHMSIRANKIIQYGAFPSRVAKRRHGSEWNAGGIPEHNDARETRDEPCLAWRDRTTVRQVAEHSEVG